MPFLNRPAVFLAIAFSAVPEKGAAQNLKSAVHGYVSVEPFEIRKEFVFRFDTISSRISAEEVDSISAGNRSGLEQSIGKWLEDRSPVEADGVPISFSLDRVHFVRPDPAKGIVVDDRDSIPADEALVGAVFAAARKNPPQRLEVFWDFFPSDGSEAVVEVGAPENRSARRLSSESPKLIWINEGINMPELLEVPDVQEPRDGWLLWVQVISTAVALGLGAIALFRKGSERKKLIWDAAAALLLAGFALIADFVGVFRKTETVSAKQADEICYRVLRNIYHAFDFRDEFDIYDTLAESTTGELLHQIYLEVQRSLQLENQGGARVRVYNVDLKKCESAGSDGFSGEGFSAACDWVAVGTVTHWGHTHDRVNRYRAELTIAPVEGKWRLVGLDLESEERMQTLRKRP